MAIVAINPHATVAAFLRYLQNLFATIGAFLQFLIHTLYVLTIYLLFHAFMPNYFSIILVRILLHQISSVRDWLQLK